MTDGGNEEKSDDGRGGGDEENHDLNYLDNEVYCAI